MKNIFTVTINPAYDVHIFLDEFISGNEYYYNKIRYDAGGKDINISKALANNNIKNKAYVILGKENSNLFIESLDKDKIDYYAEFIDGKIRENLVIHDKDNNETKLNSDTFVLQIESINSLFYELNNNLQNDDIVIFSGRLPSNINKKYIIDILNQISKKSKLIIDSSSFDLSDIENINPYLIKPNYNEFKNLFKYSEEINDYESIKSIISNSKIQRVLITNSDNNSFFYENNSLYIINPPKLEKVLSTIGAGDSTIAGFVFGLFKNMDTISILKEAFAFGSSKCLEEGTNPPKMNNINHLKDQIKVIKL